MKPRFRTRLGVPIAVALLFAGPPAATSGAASRPLVITDLGTFDGMGSVGNALNDRGQIAGVAAIAPFEVRGFLLEEGGFTDLGRNMVPLDINDHGQILLQQLIANPQDPNECFLRDGETTVSIGSPAGWQCHVRDLNNRGQVVGTIMTYQAPPFSNITFLWESGHMTALGTLGGDWAYAAAINDRGQVVGSSTTASGGYAHAFLWEGGTMTDLSPPGTLWSSAYAINNRGQVVIQGGSHLYLWESGSMTDLGTLGGDISEPIDINERGQILLAVLEPSAGHFRFGLWEEGALTWLPSLGSGMPGAAGLNDRGQVVGADRADAAGVTHVVLWTPGAASSQSSSPASGIGPQCRPGG